VILKKFEDTPNPTLTPDVGNPFREKPHLIMRPCHLYLLHRGR